MSEYEPRTYVKGDVTRVAKSPAAAVALEFDGYKLRKDAAPSEEAPAPVESGTPAPELPTPKTATPSIFGSKPTEQKD